VTDASSRSLKLLPILGVPSLPSRPSPFPLPPGLRPANSAVRLGESGPVGRCLWFPLLALVPGPGRRVMGAVELAEESDVWDCWATSVGVLWVGRRRARFLGSPRRVALGS